MARKRPHRRNYNEPGHAHEFWQSGGGYGRNVDQPGTLMNMIDYIHMNPVRRGLVETAVQWKWSSAAWYLRVGEPVIVLDPIPAEWFDG